MNRTPQIVRLGSVLVISLVSIAIATAIPNVSPQSTAPLDAADSGHYYQPAQGLLAQPSPLPLIPNAVYHVDAFPLYPPQLAAGDGRQETAAYCNTCHSLRYITMQPPLPAATWEAEVTKMDKALGGQFPPDVPAKIIRYLSEHYTPETRRR